MNNKIITNTRYLRKNLTSAEKRLWYHLRGRRFYQYKFKRQYWIENYILDFVCLEKNLCIEVDGGQHNFLKNIKYDEKRTCFLKSKGFQILRFWNTEVLQNTEGVLEKILYGLKK